MIRAAFFPIAVLGVLMAGCHTLPVRIDVPHEQASPVARYGSLADFGERIEAMLKPEESAHWLLDRNQLALTARLALVNRLSSVPRGWGTSRVGPHPVGLSTEREGRDSRRRGGSAREG